MSLFRNTNFKTAVLKIWTSRGVCFTVKEVIPIMDNVSTPFRGFIKWIDGDEPYYDFDDLDCFYRIERKYFEDWVISVE